MVYIASMWFILSALIGRYLLVVHLIIIISRALHIFPTILIVDNEIERIDYVFVPTQVDKNAILIY